MRAAVVVGVALLAGTGCFRGKDKPAAKLESFGIIDIAGDLDGSKDISGIAFAREHMLLVSNESGRVEILRKHDRGYKAIAPVVLEKRPPGAKEHHLDLEAVAADGDVVYAIGSHSRKKGGEVAPHRDGLFRFTLAADGTAGEVSRTSLRPLIEANEVLKQAIALPAEGGGINIEGLAVRDGRLFVGFRSPAPRGWAFVVETTFDRPEAGALRMLLLGGRGVRDLAAVKGGFLVLAGPSGDGAEHDFYLYFWDGRDCRPDVKPGQCRPLCKVPHVGKQSPEGLAVTSETDDAYELVIVHDGIVNGEPTRYRLKK